MSTEFLVGLRMNALGVARVEALMATRMEALGVARVVALMAGGFGGGKDGGFDGEESESFGLGSFKLFCVNRLFPCKSIKSGSGVWW